MVADLPLFTSVDIRDAGFKMAVVDTNLFPAGFNNLCAIGLDEASAIMKQALLDRVTECGRVLILAEKHTRNIWYLENVYTLKEMIERAGFEVTVAAPLDIQSQDFCDNISVLELKTALGHILKVYPLDPVLKCYKDGQKDWFDLIIMNNDLISGIPATLLEADVPIYPSPHAGWHARRKSNHFQYKNNLIKTWADKRGEDPWLYSCLFRTADNVSINEQKSREHLVALAEDLFVEIRQKYKEHGVTSAPFIFLKANSGSYGMGVTAIEDPKDILSLNRKLRNKLSKGKSASVIDSFLLQEGVPSSQVIEGQTSEVCLYQIANQFVGAFYRTHANKNSRESLNSQGMDFRKICSEGDMLDKDLCERQCGVGYAAEHLKIYQELASIAGIAAKEEILKLEKEAMA